MSNQNFYDLLAKEVKRIDQAGTSKRHENVIQGFTQSPNPQAIIDNKQYLIFNSNDYLGLRHHHLLKQAEHAASEKFGTGPGAVRFISGSLSIHKDLEKALAHFHGRDDAIVFSSAFAANLAVLFSLIKGQAKDSVVSGRVLVISDELNHRSIFDGIRLANLSSDEKAIFKHGDSTSLAEVLKTNIHNFDRVIVVTDGVFSMLGEYQDLAAIRLVINEYDSQYSQGALLIVDDCHGVAACGSTGRGIEEVTSTQADVLVGTLGKGFGADGGYVVGNHSLINYLREAAATYIYSNSISPGTAGAALAAVTLLDSAAGKKLLHQSQKNIQLFKTLLKKTSIKLAAESTHPIQPVLIGDPVKTGELTQRLFENHILTTKINYPVVQVGRDEIRVQISATHTSDDIKTLVKQLVAHTK